MKIASLVKRSIFGSFLLTSILEKSFFGMQISWSIHLLSKMSTALLTDSPYTVSLRPCTAVLAAVMYVDYTSITKLVN